MSRKSDVRPEVVFDDDNPEWTEQDFKDARPAEEVLPPHILKAFPKLRGAQKAPTKIPVSLRLSPDVVEHFKATGDGWQTRIDETLKAAIKKAS
ncbi:MAG: BrnA antitoxin family protein [Devosia sp.]